MKVPRSHSFILLLLFFGGCATYEPRPLDPPATKSSFENSRLTHRVVLEELARRNLAETNAVTVSHWDLDRLFVAALVLNPEIRAVRAEAEVVEAGIITAKARPNPTLTLSPEYAFPTTPPWILGFALDLPIETMGKRGDRISVAEAKARAAQLGLADTMWQLRSRLRNALVEYISGQFENKSIGEESKARGELLRFAEKKLAEGEASIFEVETARTEQLASQLNLQASNNRVVESRARLAAIIGVPTEGLADIALSWRDFETPQGVDLNRAKEFLEEAPLTRADIQRLLAEYDSAEAALKLEIAKQYPDIHFNPGYTWDQGTHKVAFGGSLTLPVFDQNQGPIAEAEAKRSAAEAHFLALQAKVINDRSVALLHYKGSVEALRDSQWTWKNVITRQERLNQRALELGELDRTAVYTAQVQSAIFNRSRLMAIREAQLSLGLIEDVIQKPLQR